MLFYLPLEPYKERYTVQLSRAVDGWFERRLNKLNVDYTRIEGKRLSDSDTIGTGIVLDACGRTYWSTSQIAELVSRIDRGDVRNGDIIYLEDFWTPGFEALPYIRALTGIDFKIYGLLHAQTVDTYDFTYPMRQWMRGFELAQASEMHGIFVTSTILKDFLHAAVFEPKEGIFLTGLPYASDEVLETAHPYNKPKEDLVVFSSRWDWEKRPGFFLEILEYVIDTRPSTRFVVTTNNPQVRSNDAQLVDLLYQYLETYPDNLQLSVNTEKWQYYNLLQRAKVQLNTSLQDFVSWTLLEATTFGCLPCYPNWRSFPEIFANHPEYLYAPRDARAAADKLVALLDNTVECDVSWVYRPFDMAAERMVNIMLGRKWEPLWS